MSINISSLSETEFDMRVKQAYQGAGKLRPTVRIRNDVTGSSYRFTKIGKGMAQVRGASQSDITPMNVSYSTATATLIDYVAPEYSDKFDNLKVNFEEETELVAVVAGAISRRTDQLIIDALDTGASSTTVSDDIGGTDTGLNADKLRRAKRLLDEKGVPTEERFFVHSAVGLEQLLGETAVTSADFNTVRALSNGEVKSFLGFNFILIEDRDEGGLPIAANVRTNYAFHGGKLGSAGLAVGLNFKTELHYIPEKTSTLINGLFSAGSVVIDSDGVYKVFSNET